jgi:hypothetical protein
MNTSFFHLQDEHGYRGKTLIDRGEIDKVHEEMGHVSVDHVHNPLKAIEKAEPVKCGDKFTKVIRGNPFTFKCGRRAGHEGSHSAFTDLRHSRNQMSNTIEWPNKKISKLEPFEVEWEWKEISKFDDEQQIIFGWAYVSHDKDGTQVIDKSGEYVPNPKDLEKAAYNFVRNCRVGRDFHGLLEKDDGSQASTLVESIYFDPEKQAAMGIPPGILPTSAWWVGLKVLRKSLWQACKKGERPMLSIHGFGTSKAVLID